MYRVPVKNRDRAMAFYSALPGADLGCAADALTFVERSDKVSMLLRVNVANRLDDALAFIWSNGGRVLDPDLRDAGEDRYALVMDCEGNHLALYAQQ